jgi:hypothetical protein
MLDFTKKPQPNRSGVSFLFGVGVVVTAMLTLVFVMGQASAQSVITHGPAMLHPVTVSTLDAPASFEPNIH